MKTKKDKLSRQIQKPHHSLSEELESNELIIDLKSYVNDLNSNNDVHYFNVQVMHNRRSIDKQAVELAKNLIIEEPPFFDTPEPLPKTSASSESGKIEILLGVAFDKSVESIDFLRIEEVEVYDESILNSCFSISSRYGTISKLHLIDCCLNAKSIEIIAKQLRAENNTIKDLSLDMNVVPEQNYHCLIDGTTLEHLSLRNCKINCKGAKFISQALEYKKPENKQNLLSLVLNGNAIEDSGLLFIAMGKECIDPICNTVERFSVSNQQRKSSLSNDVPSTRTSNDETKNPEDIISNISNSILSVTNIINGDLHPLLTTVYKDGNLKYCVGNFALAYLNLSYNYFGKIGMHALIEAAEYQSSVGSQINGLGLMGVKAEGLKRKENVDEEIEELNKILRNRSLPKLYDRRHLISYTSITL